MYARQRPKKEVKLSPAALQTITTVTRDGCCCFAGEVLPPVRAAMVVPIIVKALTTKKRCYADGPKTISPKTVN
jgi:hypothetical protein